VTAMCLRLYGSVCGKAGREGGEPMPVAYLNATELFYVEVG
jgi:hypothetical protein